MSQGGVRVVARSGRTGSRGQAGPSSAVVSNQGRSGSAGRAASTPPLPSPHVAAVSIGPAPGDDGLTGFELPDATDDDGDGYLDVHGASMGFGSTVPAVKQVAHALPPPPATVAFELVGFGDDEAERVPLGNLGARDMWLVNGASEMEI